MNRPLIMGTAQWMLGYDVNESQKMLSGMKKAPTRAESRRCRHGTRTQGQRQGRRDEGAGEVGGRTSSGGACQGG